MTDLSDLVKRLRDDENWHGVRYSKHQLIFAAADALEAQAEDLRHVTEMNAEFKNAYAEMASELRQWGTVQEGIGKGQVRWPFMVKAADALEAQAKQIAELEARATKWFNAVQDNAKHLRAAHIAGMREAAMVPERIYEREASAEIADAGDYYAGRKYLASEIAAAIRTAIAEREKQG